MDDVKKFAWGLLRSLDTALLASRAAASCSGVRTSGSDTVARSFAGATWRLCLFSSILFIPVLFAWLLHNPADHRLGREHERGDGSRILQSRTSYLGGVDHAGLHQVFVSWTRDILVCLGD